MKVRRKRRTAVIALVAAVLLAGAGAAIAYWTTTGSGTGTATTGTGVPVTVTQDSTITGLFPGGPNVAIDFTINNPAPGPQFVTAVAIAVTGTSNGGCTAADFQVTQPTITAANIPAGATSYLGASTGAAVRLIDTGVNQNACKGVTVNLSYTVS